MTTVNKRLTDLESESGKGEKGMAVYWEDRPMAKIIYPQSRRHEEITVDNFRAEFSEGTLITVKREAKKLID